MTHAIAGIACFLAGYLLRRWIVPNPRQFAQHSPQTLENAVESLLSDVRGGSPHAYEPRDDVSHLKLEDLRRALERRRHEGTHVFYCSGDNYQTGSRIKSQ